MKKIKIIGAGPSGLIAAIVIKRASKNLDVTIYEQNKIGKKILMAGNGKCNISNKQMIAEFYNNPVFVKHAITNFNNKEIIAFFKSIGVLLKTDLQGRMYPYNEMGSTVLNALTLECKKLKINIVSKYVNTLKGDYNIIATGGEHHELPKSINHTITNLSPGLSPLVIKDLKNLDGIRIKCAAYINDFFEEGEIHFKKDGISGILGYQISSIYARTKQSTIYLDLFPKQTYNELVNILKEYKNDSLYVDEAFSGIINEKLLLAVLNTSNITYKGIKASAFKQIDKLASVLKKWELKIVESYQLKYAQVTNGGVQLTEVNNKTFESLIKKDVYIVGEVLDIDGLCGGYNMHFAFASGFAAAKDIIRKEEL